MSDRLCTEAHSHISSYKAKRPDEQIAGDHKLVNHKMERLKNLSINSLRSKENHCEMRQENPYNLILCVT